MKKMLFLLLACMPLFAYAKTMEERETRSSIDVMNNAESDYYIIDTAETGVSQDFTYEATLNLYMGGYLSINDISPLIQGDWSIMGNYIKFTINEDMLLLLSKRGTVLLPIGTASDGKTYSLKLNFIN